MPDVMWLGSCRPVRRARAAVPAGGVSGAPVSRRGRVDGTDRAEETSLDVPFIGAPSTCFVGRSKNPPRG